MGLDINMLRAEKGGDPEKVRESQRRRFASVELVDEVLELDARWLKVKNNADEARYEFGVNNKEIAALKKAKKDASHLIPLSGPMKAKIAALEKETEELETARDKKLNKIGNIVEACVPTSQDEEKDSKVESAWSPLGKDDQGEWIFPTTTSDTGSEPLHHHDLLWRIGGYEPDKGVGVAGHRGYFLTGPGVMLNTALQSYSLQFLMQRGYTAAQPPYLMNKDVMSGVAQLEEFDEALYKVIGERGDEKYLIATSEQPMCGYYKGEWLEPNELPKKLAGLSTCFRKESGSHGRDTWGIFRVHQFEKVEQFCVTTPENSEAMQESMRIAAEEFMQSLGVPYHVINVVSGELNNAAAKKYDLEGWFPASKNFRELVSCSNCTDYQSRPMGIRCGTKKMGDREKKFVHLLNSTLCACTRMICVLLELNQTADGVKVPEALQPFVGGTTFWPFIRSAKPNVNEAKAAKKAAKAGGAKAPAPAKAPKAPKASKDTTTPTPVVKAEVKKATPEAKKAAPASKKAAPEAKKAAPEAKKAGLLGPKELNDALFTQSFVAGWTPTKADAEAFYALKDVPDAGNYPHLFRWYNQVASYSSEQVASW